MITRAIFDQMISDNVAGLVADSNFFIDEAPLQKNGKPAKGVWLVERSGTIAPTVKLLNRQSIVDFYVAFNDKTEIDSTLTAIQQWMANWNSRGVCELSGGVDGTSYGYKVQNVRIWPEATPENQGITENGLLVKMASARVIYDAEDY